MKTNNKKLLAALLLAATCNTQAQHLNTAYFLDGFAQGHQMNPAKEYDRQGYFSLPMLNINAGIKGNLALQNIFMPNPSGKGLTTYLHPDFSYEQAMKGFSDNNKIITDERIEIIGLGFHAMGGYNTISLGIRSNAGVNVPFELFSMTKRLENRDYELDDFGVNASAWAELALGHSRQITDAWRIGAKAKILLGIGYAKVEMDDLALDLENPGRWKAEAYATMEMGVQGFTWGPTKTKSYHSKPGTYQQISFDNADIDGIGLNGGGFAVDLGAEWNLEKDGLLDGLKVSAALLDLGFINWSHVAKAYNKGEEFVFDGFKDIQVKGGPGRDLSSQTDELADKLSDLYSLQDGGIGSKSTTLGATLNLAAEYKLPTYDKLRFGLLSTTHIHGVYTWNEERLSVNLSPVKWFEVATSLGLGTTGASWGWVVNIHPQGFNLYLGMDHTLGKLSKQYVPLKSNANFCLGINFPLGKTRM